MMDKSSLIKDIAMVLDKTGFDMSEIRGGSVSSFDMVSRRDDLILIIKVLPPGTEMRREWSSEVIALSKVLDASPMILVGSSSASKYKDGVLYVKMGLPLLTFNTFFDHLVEGVPPMIYHASRGFFVSMDGTRMNAKRSEMGLSLGALAESAGVSRKAVQMYEGGMGADIEVALKIEDMLGLKLIQPLDPFSHSDELQEIREGFGIMEGMKKEVFEHLDSLGMEVVPTHKCPFDALARTNMDLILTTVTGPGSNIKEDVRSITGLGRVTGADPLVIVPDNRIGRKMKGLPVLGLSELQALSDTDQLIGLIRERSVIFRR